MQRKSFGLQCPVARGLERVGESVSTRLTTTLGSVPAGHLATLEQLRALAYREASTWLTLRVPHDHGGVSE